MKPIAIDTNQGAALDVISTRCGEVTVGCTDVAGIVKAVISSSEALRDEHEMLRETVTALEADQTKVSEASDEARLLSESAIERLSEGTDLIQSSLEQIGAMLDLVDALGQHITGFSAAMEQVRRTAKDIEEISETTNILALNATIEAMRAGDAGRTFAVVADEVKSLANDTRKATEEIATTIDALGDEASVVIGRIEAGSKASAKAKASIAQIESTITNVGGLVEEVDKQNDVIARANGTITNHVDAVQRTLITFDEVSKKGESELLGAHNRMGDLENTANSMFDHIVKAGLSPQDSEMVKLAQNYGAKVQALAEAAIEAGEITQNAFFDTDYIEVPGTNPVLYRTQISDWTDANWRPIFDELKASDTAVVAAVCTDNNGFLPTHLTEKSRTPTGNEEHDTDYCRNGRIFWDTVDVQAKASKDPYMMSVYRADMKNETYIIVRNVFVPIFINGRRYGDFELAYSFD